MYKTIFILILSLNISKNCFAGDTAKCRCIYSSSYNIFNYKLKISSVNKKYENAFIIGQRYFSGANMLVITNDKNYYKAVFYDLLNNKKKIYSGKIVDEMANKLVASTKSLEDCDKIPSQYISHDFSFFISLKKGGKIHEICYSQLLTVKDKPIGKLLIYYMENFK